MQTVYPTSQPPRVDPPPAAKRAPGPAKASPGAALGAWRYFPEKTTRVTYAVAIVVSIGLHAVVLLGIHPPAKKPRPVMKDDLIAITITQPDLKELDEPEPTPRDADTPPPDPGSLVPMQQDVLSLARPSDFVQPLDLSSLLPQPDLSQAKVFTIPEHIARGGKIGEGMVIFNIADLDRIPEAVYQPAPIFPPGLRQQVDRATVKVEFIVDTDGHVSNAFVVDSTHPGFDEAAITGVTKWRFRAGMKNGRKVNTRMQVPIIFKIIPID